MNIRRLRPEDQTEWLRMRLSLWPEYTSEEFLTEMSGIMTNPYQPVFVVERPEGGLGGFVEVSLHHEYTPGCKNYPAGYIEGWYVDPDLRNKGWGGLLIKAAEDWARSQGCQEMGSDTEIDNITSYKAHQALGYRVAEELIHFHKML